MPNLPTRNPAAGELSALSGKHAVRAATRWACLALAPTLLAASPTVTVFAQALTPPPASIPAVSVNTIDNASQTRLVRAEALLENGQWREAIENVVSVMDSAAAQLVQVANTSRASELGFATYLPARQVTQQWLASLAHRAPEALELYRRQVDVRAERLYLQGVELRDESMLMRVVDEMFVSGHGDDALDWLGELARQRGEYTLARHYWERIHRALRYVEPDVAAGREAYPWWYVEDASLPLGPRQAGVPPTSTTWLAYPDSDRDPTEVWSRLVLASILEGNHRRAAKELAVLERSGAQRAGVMAGRHDRWVVLLRELLARGRGWGEPPATSDWTTLGGSPQRFKRIDEPFDLGGRPIWRQPLPRLSVVGEEDGDRQVRTAEDPAGLLSVHPVVVNGVVVYAVGLTEGDIEAIDLQSGALVFPRRTMVTEQEIPHLPGAPTVPRITLTAHGRTLFALTLDRRGLPARMVALDLEAERRLLYAISLDGPQWPGSWIIEGVPLADERALYASVRRIDQVRHECQIACFDTRDGALIWRRAVCEAETDREMSRGYVSNLLALDQGTLYYNTNLGVIAALRASDGFPRWLVRYPSRGFRNVPPDRNDSRRFRDLTPCLVYRDVVVVAPRDCESIFALDAVTGSTLWVTPPNLGADVVHLLGVGNDRLIASGECLYWFDVYTGQPRGRFPSTFHAVPGHARPSPRGYGRGLLVSEQVYWPTRSTIYVFDQQTVKTDLGWQPRLTRRIELEARGATGGNLVLQDNVLLIAAATQLFAFNQTGRRHVRNGRGSGRAIEPGLSPDH